MKRIAAIVGDYYHEAALARESLERTFRDKFAGGEFKLEFAEAGDILSVLKSEPELLVLFKENRLNPQEEQVKLWMDEAASEAVSRYVQAGGSVLAWHAGLASYPENSAYINMLKGSFISHPPENMPVRYTPVHTDETGWPDETFEVPDEHYFVNCREEQTTVFLRSASAEGESAAGWRHEHGQGKVCCLTPAHRREGLLAGPFLSLLGNCLDWCLS